MNLYEFEGKALFERFEILVPKGETVQNGDDVEEVYACIGGQVVVKAQMLTGKRGKAGAIRFCNSSKEVNQAVADLFDLNVRGQQAASIRIEEQLPIVQEHYLSITYDTNNKQPSLTYSPKGGMDIEDVQEKDITRIPLDVRAEQVMRGRTFHTLKTQNDQILGIR